MNHCEYDLGSRQGFGPVRHSPQTQAFHAPWEKRVNAMYSLAVRMGVFNMDEYRHAIERMEPRHYRPANYHERSLTSLATRARNSSAARKPPFRLRCLPQPGAAT